jgi:hypothetical protein
MVIAESIVVLEIISAMMISAESIDLANSYKGRALRWQP